MKTLPLSHPVAVLLALFSATSLAAPGKIEFSDITPIEVTEDTAQQPTAQIRLVRTGGTDGVLPAVINAMPAGPCMIPGEVQWLRYRFAGGTSWTNLQLHGNVDLIFPAGVDALNLEIQAADDEAWDGLSGVLRLWSGDQTILGTKLTLPVRVIGNEPKPVMTITPLSVPEGTGGPAGDRTNHMLWVHLDRPIANCSTRFMVSPAGATGTAVLDLDYEVMFMHPPGFPLSGSQDFYVNFSTKHDSDIEPDETFTFTVSVTADSSGEGSEALAISATASVTILNDDYPPVTIPEATVEEGHSGTALLTFPVSLAAPLANDVSFQWSTLSSGITGRATAGQDFIAASGTVLIPSGQTTAVINVTVNGDTTAEPDEVLLLSLSNPVGGISLPMGNPRGTILDDDVVRIRIGSPRVGEGAAGALTTMSFPVTLTIPQAGPVSFNYTTAAGTAEAGTDFVSASGSVTIPAGGTSAAIQVQLKGDADIEPDESFNLTLSSGSGAALPPTSPQGWILNDDLTVFTPPVTWIMTETDTNFDHAIFFTPQGPSAPLPGTKVDWNIDAPPGSITPTSGTLNFSSGFYYLVFTVLGDNVPENDTAINITFSNPVNVSLAGGATFPIMDLRDNDRRTLTITGGTVAEGNSGTASLPFTIALDGALATDLTFSYAANGGTAVAGEDYPAASDVAAIPAGSTSVTVNLSVSGDTVIELNETAGLALSGFSVPVTRGNETMGIILTDDMPVLRPAIPMATINETDATQGIQIEFTATGIVPGGPGASADYTVTGPDGSALPRTGRLIFINDTPRSIPLIIPGDQTPEVDAIVRVTFSNPVGLSLADGASFDILRIVDDDHSVTVAGGSVMEGHTGQTVLPFTVNMNAVLASDFTFNYTTSGGTAVAGEDYVVASGSATIPAGSTSVAVNAAVTGDTTIEINETVGLVLSNFSQTVKRGTDTPGTILTDDFAVLQPSAPMATVTETDLPQLVTVSFRADGLPSFATVHFETSAPAGTIMPVSATYPLNGPGDPTMTITLMVLGDQVQEEEAIVSVTFSDPQNLSLSGGATFDILRVLDDDHPFITVTGGSVAEGHAGEASLPFTVGISAAQATDVSFNYTTTGVTASAGEDYTAASGSATITAGATEVTVNVPVLGDTQIELDETLSLSLSGFSRSVRRGTDTPGTIVTDDFPPGPVPAATLVTEASGLDTVQAWFSVDLSAPRTVPFLCRVSTRSGTALAGSDFNPLAPTNITFAAGDTRKWVAITVTASPEVEDREEFYLDVEALDSREIKSAACSIERLAVTDFWRPFPGIYAVKFPTGLGQRYIIDNAAALTGPWIPVSTLLQGTGSPATQLLFSDTDNGFFRVRAAPPLPPGTPAAGS